MVSILNINRILTTDSFLLKIKKLDPYKCAFCMFCEKRHCSYWAHFLGMRIEWFFYFKKKEIFTVTDTSVVFVEKEFIFGSLVKLYKIEYVIA